MRGGPLTGRDAGSSGLHQPCVLMDCAPNPLTRSARLADSREHARLSTGEATIRSEWHSVESTGRTSTVDTTRPSVARIYDYLLGGTSNFPVDREACAHALKAMPELHDIVWSNRGFHQRSASWIASQGVSQFLDIGSGLPTVGNTHEVVRKVIPDARVCYVDLDPAVAEQSDALLAADGGTAFVTADLRDPDTLLAAPELHNLIDFGQPVGVLMTAVLHFVADSSDPWGIVARYVTELAPGSYLAVTHATRDRVPPSSVQASQDAYRDAREQLNLRTKKDIARLFDGLELVVPYAGAKPDLVYMGLWGCLDPQLADTDGSRWGFCGVGRRP